ncbi:hypothetical protein HHK36_020129 [Tetracentron sinense]|uniref:BEACH domain-containing protein n=1 Tax=Tetracentron sinense TaxID=13715 RepID=A0A834YT27_TETSI|nr:hypothetical protein HHK36_020129 [Tetracentron sinense]
MTLLPLVVSILSLSMIVLLAADALALESALAMISPGWSAAFASPPTALALAMIAAEAVETPNKSPAAPKDKASAKAAALAAARDLERNAKIGSGRGLSAVAVATCAQRRSASDIDRVNRWNVSEAMGTAWMECLQSVDTKLVSGKDFSALSYKYVAVLVASFALERNMQWLEIDRHAQVDVIAQHRLDTGIHVWRKLIHCLIELQCLFGAFGDNLYNPERVFWKLDFMVESSSRMRRCLRKNYKGSDHLGAAADYEDHLQMKHDQENVTFPSTASILIAEAISMEESGDNQQRLPTTAEAPLRVSLEYRDAQVSSDTDLIQNPSAVAPRYVPSELDERSILELSSSMVRPLRVIRGTFQVFYYLVRVEPFTTLSIQLQGGKFDHADRMFSDIAATWNGVLEDMNDVKELVPELFYIPEILTNENSIDFGTTQLGGKLDQIAYFGQTPSQLLTGPHLKKKPLADVLHLQIVEAKVHLLDFALEHITLSLKEITPDPLIKALEYVIGDSNSLEWET